MSEEEEKPEEKPEETPPQEDLEAKSLFIGNVNFQTKSDELKELFEECGQISRVTILHDKFGMPKGYAYIEFENLDSVEAALAYNDSMFKERKITVVPKRKNLPAHSLRGGYQRRGGFNPRRRPRYRSNYYY